MDLNIVILLIVSAIVSGSLSYFQYFHNQERDTSLILPALMRFLSLFALLMLLVNPRYEAKEYIMVKPSLQIALDGSKSMSPGTGESSAEAVLDRLRSDSDLNDRFDLDYFIFGNGLRLLDSVSFSDSQTDIDQALSQLDELSASKTAPVVLLSDGIQTYGKNYFYTQTRQRIFPVITGDTTKMTNLEVALVNVNSYASLGNTFEIEVFVNFYGTGTASSELVIESQGKTIAKRSIQFEDGTRSQQMTFEIEAEEIGRQLYRARIQPMKDEKEVLDNQKTFEVEVIEEKTEVAVVFAFPHPDLGVIRQSLETRENKRVDLIPVAEWSEETGEYPVYVIYQPDSRFQELFSYLNRMGKNYFLVTGASSDWDFLNRVIPEIRKEPSSLTEEFFPLFAEDFQSFYAEDIGFSEFPSLTFNLGQVDFEVPHYPILRQIVNGIKTDQPMLTTFETEQGRRVVLFGENIWKWRLYAYQRELEFNRFDRFLGSLFQYLSLSKKKVDLELFYDKSNFDDQAISIKARKYDNNLNLDLSSPLEVRVDKGSKAYPMFVSKNFYEVRLAGLDPGTHEFEVRDVSDGSSQKGKFEILPYSAEQMKTLADLPGMSYLAEQSGGQLFYPSQADDLVRTLLADPEFKPVEKVERKRISLIDQKWLFALIVLSLSIEWIIRKYRGLI
jgi:hypothetical protein